MAANLNAARDTHVVMLACEFQPGFRVNLHHKDMGVASDAITPPC
jgi:3-hydroxyisobutyrate dehydrogenase-like beta-hydroxyacid dehydrogenase